MRITSNASGPPAACTACTGDRCVCACVCVGGGVCCSAPCSRRLLWHRARLFWQQQWQLKPTGSCWWRPRLCTTALGSGAAAAAAAAPPYLHRCLSVFRGHHVAAAHAFEDAKGHLSPQGAREGKGDLNQTRLRCLERGDGPLWCSGHAIPLLWCLQQIGPPPLNPLPHLHVNSIVFGQQQAQRRDGARRRRVGQVGPGGVGAHLRRSARQAGSKRVNKASL